MDISSNLNENIARLEELFKDCADVIKGKIIPCRGLTLYMIYIDNMIDRRTIDRHTITPLLESLKNAAVSKDAAFDRVKSTLSTLDLNEDSDFNSVLTFILSGDTALFVDGADKVIIIASRGFSNRGVTEPTTEITVMGSKEAFSEVMRINTVLIRRRIRDTRLKVKQLRVGERSQTDIAYMYVEDIARPNIVDEVDRLLNSFNVDAIPDMGVLEQLIEKSWYSPFPQAEITERPDKAAASILEGRVAVIADNSPFVLLVPVTLNTLYQSGDDYYQRFWIMSLTRLLRYGAGLIAIALPGFFLAASVYHPDLLPSALMLKMSAARVNVPFPAVAEILLMEMAFELLREAGTRMPRVVGGTLGIVGGLIIGNAAVEAGLVSPIVVVVVALTAIASFAIPSNSLVTGYRIVKYLVTILAACFGLLGFWIGLLVILIHLCGLKSFNIPYLYPFVSFEHADGADLRDSLIRFPPKFQKKRPFFASPKQRSRMKSE